MLLQFLFHNTLAVFWISVNENTLINRRNIAATMIIPYSNPSAKFRKYVKDDHLTYHKERYMD